MTKQRRCPAITLGLPSTLFYPRASGLPNGFSVTRPRRPLLRSLNSSLYSSHHSTSTEHSTANAKDRAIGQSPVTNNTGRTLSFLYVIASYIIPSYNIASYNVIRQAGHAGGGTPPHMDRSGKYIPFWSQKLGRSFRQACHPESASRSEPEFWDAVSAEASTGKCIPFRALIPGHSFRMRPRWESSSRSEGSFRDAISA